MNQNEQSMDVVSAPIILPYVNPRKYTDTHMDDCREEYSEEFSETYVHPPLSQYPNLLDSTDLNTIPLYKNNLIQYSVPLIDENDGCGIWYCMTNLFCCR
jgi:hypothetical protein|uniref:Uncharacterized protein n=1 Tax=viral metagenome TaxID=1070528 RepID=A0A6C0BFW4_9ZZZZ